MDAVRRRTCKRVYKQARPLRRRRLRRHRRQATGRADRQQVHQGSRLPRQRAAQRHAARWATCWPREIKAQDRRSRACAPTRSATCSAPSRASSPRSTPGRPRASAPRPSRAPARRRGRLDRDPAQAGQDATRSTSSACRSKGRPGNPPDAGQVHQQGRQRRDPGLHRLRRARSSARCRGSAGSRACRCKPA